MRIFRKLRKRIQHIRFNHSHGHTSKNEKPGEKAVPPGLTSLSSLELLNSRSHQVEPIQIPLSPDLPQSSTTSLQSESSKDPLPTFSQMIKIKLNAKTDFLLQIMKVCTPRQSGRLVNIFVNYRYSGKICKQLDEGKIPDGVHDYMAIRGEILEEFNNMVKYPPEIFWEFLLYKITKHVYRKFNLHAISMQLQIEPSFNIHPIEPGFHSAIITIGPIEPLADIVQYDPNPGFL